MDKRAESSFYQSTDLKFLTEIIEDYAQKGVQTKLVPSNVFGMPVYRLFIDIEDKHYKRNNEARKEEFGK